MPKTIFDRSKPETRNNAINMTQEEFVEKYSNTTATPETLTSVYKSFAKERRTQEMIQKQSETASDLVKSSSYVNEEGDITTIKKSKKSGKVIVESSTATDNPNSKGLNGKEDAEDDGEEKPKDKAGRTPRMRELIKELGKDKQKVKKALVDEGFNCSGSGFHSEWNRISK